ncbi:DUF6307 family protein [Actinosynnema sp. NPDC023587]|uniref:DUF6307 family protein n=1 Tax=Actinosynnema sp. NPDC023587 TaxID=3154695 RepID=UPI0033F90259
MSSQYVSRYEARVELVRATVREMSDLDDKAAFAVAVRVVHELDHSPESVR